MLIEPEQDLQHVDASLEVTYVLSYTKNSQFKVNKSNSRCHIFNSTVKMNVHEVSNFNNRLCGVLIRSQLKYQFIYFYNYLTVHVCIFLKDNCEKNTEIIRIYKPMVCYTGVLDVLVRHASPCITFIIIVYHASYRIHVLSIPEKREFKDNFVSTRPAFSSSPSVLKSTTWERCRTKS